jgi:hypothetical protein
MRWRESPPYFCMFTETCAVLANTIPVSHPTHPYTIPQPVEPIPPFHPMVTWPYNPNPAPTPLQYTDVYLDDFMVVAQAPHHTHTMNTLLHHLDSIFQDPPASTRCAIVSQSKLIKGDSTFSTQKRLLGWGVDTSRMEVSLPEHRSERQAALIQSFLAKKYTSKGQWQKLLGEQVLAIHSSKYLFSILQAQLANTNTLHLCITPLTWLTLQDWHQLVCELHERPVPISMLVPHAPHYWAATDAPSASLGSFWLPSNLVADDQQCVWRHPLPAHIAARLLSAQNPTGDITINTLELAAVYVSLATQLHHTPRLPYTPTCSATDNTSAQAWVAKGSPTSALPGHK